MHFIREKPVFNLQNAETDTKFYFIVRYFGGVIFLIKFKTAIPNLKIEKIISH